MKKVIIILIITIGALASCKSSKNNTKEEVFAPTIRDNFRVMFYNTENFFDTINDPNKLDDEFTPSGAKYWNGYRYRLKIRMISQVIMGIGEWEAPQIVALSEVEHKKCLEDLINKTPLYQANYKIIHHESPDARGIDVALLYRPKFFKLITEQAIPVIWPSNLGTGSTRDILYVKGLTNKNDTLHIFVNHWPSRYSGQMETEGKRIHVAKMVRHASDSILKVDKNANIVIVGDLNDGPTDKSLLEGLKTETVYDNIKHNKLYSLSYYLQEVKKLGTHKYQGQWEILDHIVISGALLDTTRNMHTSLNDAHIYNPDFMLEPDETNTGKKVFRTYLGYKYNGGYSDHLPVYVDFYNE